MTYIQSIKQLIRSLRSEKKSSKSEKKIVVEEIINDEEKEIEINKFKLKLEQSGRIIPICVHHRPRKGQMIFSLCNKNVQLEDIVYEGGFIRIFFQMR